MNKRVARPNLLLVARQPCPFAARPQAPHRAAAVGAASTHHISVNIHGYHGGHPLVSSALWTKARSSKMFSNQVQNRATIVLIV